MGESRRKKAVGPTAFAKVDFLLNKLKIPRNIGFYDDPVFLKHEEEDPKFLENYASWVHYRTQSDNEIARVVEVVPKLCAKITEVFRREGMEGGCAVATCMITRMLERLGIWNYGVIGSLTLEVVSKGLWRGMHIIDRPDFPGAVVGHSWVVAPPFVIVDATIDLQRWDKDPMRDYIPDFLAIKDEWTATIPRVDDVVSAETRSVYAAKEGRDNKYLHLKVSPQLATFWTLFPSYEIKVGELIARYVPTAVRLPDSVLEEINSQSTKSPSAKAIWEQEIGPMFR